MINSNLCQRCGDHCECSVIDDDYLGTIWICPECELDLEHERGELTDEEHAIELTALRETRQAHS